MIEEDYHLELPGERNMNTTTEALSINDYDYHLQMDYDGDGPVARAHMYSVILTYAFMYILPALLGAVFIIILGMILYYRRSRRVEAFNGLENGLERHRSINLFDNANVDWIEFELDELDDLTAPAA